MPMPLYFDDRQVVGLEVLLFWKLLLQFLLCGGAFVVIEVYIIEPDTPEVVTIRYLPFLFSGGGSSSGHLGGQSSSMTTSTLSEPPSSGLAARRNGAPRTTKGDTDADSGCVPSGLFKR